VRELEDGGYEVQDLNEMMVPSGPTRLLAREALLADYLPEPEVYQKQVLPRMQELASALAWGDRYRRQEKFFSAQIEYGKALALDEDNVRATFGIGLCYLNMHDLPKAEVVFQKLVSMDCAFQPAHKHLFNEFGIALRKAGMFCQAMEYYGRALAWDPRDENLLHNLARAAYQQGETAVALDKALDALAINPDLQAAMDIRDAARRRLERQAGGSRGGGC